MLLTRLHLVVPWTLEDTACWWFVVALAANEVCQGMPALYDRTDPWGTPYCTVSTRDDVPSTRTDWVLPDRCDDIRLWTVFPMPYVMLSQLSRIPWLTQSNTADRSSSPNRVRLPSSSALINSELREDKRQRVWVRFPDRPARSEINFSGLYIQRSWLTSIELVLGLTIWVHFLPVPLDPIV